MDALKEIGQLKKFALSKIEGAAKCAETSKIPELSRLLEAIEKEERQASDQKERIQEYEKALKGSASLSKLLEPVDLEEARSESVLTKVSGAETRANFIEQCLAAGSPLTSVRGALFRTVSGKSVAVLFSNQHFPHKWWFGWSRDLTDVTVFLCPTDEGKVVPFIVPKSEIYPFWNRLSKDMGGNKKFIVVRNDDRWKIKVPAGGGEVVLDPYESKYSELR